MRGAGHRLWLLLGSWLAVSAGWAQSNGEVGFGIAWQRVTGSEDSFQSQYPFGSGLFLSRLSLDLRPWIPGFSRFRLEAQGFGAEPDGRGRLQVAWDREWQLELDFRRRERFFFSPGWDLGTRREQWAMQRWHGKLIYDGFSRAQLQLALRHVHRSGSITGPFYGLGEPYVATRRLGDDLDEASFSLITKGLPVSLLLEQGVAQVRNRFRLFPANQGSPAGGQDPDVLAELKKPGTFKTTSPTTRLAAAYNDSRWDIGVEALYRRDRSHNDLSYWERYLLGEGNWGSLSFLEEGTSRQVGSVKRAAAHVGFALGHGFNVAVRSNREERDSDTRFVGQRVLVLDGPGGVVEIPVDWRDSGVFDLRDTSHTLEAGWQGDKFGITAYRRLGEREVDWRRSQESPSERYQRDARGWGLVARWKGIWGFSGEAGGERGTFGRVIFRVEPETTRRVWMKLRYQPTAGFELAASGSHERADNPSTVANANYKDQELSLSASIFADSGARLSLLFTQLRVTSDVQLGLVPLPVQPGVSSYELKLRTAALRGSWPFSQRLRVEGGITVVENQPDGTAFSSHSGDLELCWEHSERWAWSLVLYSWGYNASASNRDDFQVRRAAVITRWRF